MEGLQGVGGAEGVRGSFVELTGEDDDIVLRRRPDVISGAGPSLLHIADDGYDDDDIDGDDHNRHYDPDHHIPSIHKKARTRVEQKNDLRGCANSVGSTSGSLSHLHYDDHQPYT